MKDFSITSDVAVLVHDRTHRDCEAKCYTTGGTARNYKGIKVKFSTALVDRISNDEGFAQQIREALATLDFSGSYLNVLKSYVMDVFAQWYFNGHDGGHFAPLFEALDRR